MNEYNPPWKKTILGEILNQTPMAESIHSSHAREMHVFFNCVQTVEDVRRKGELFLDGSIVLENDGFLVYYVWKEKSFYVYSKVNKKFISVESILEWKKWIIRAFKNILDDSTGKWIYIELEPEIWMHLSNEMKSIEFQIQRNSKWEKTYLYKAPSELSDEERRLFADTMGSWEHIPTRSRFANIVWALNPYTGDPIMLAITTDIKLQ